MLDSAVVKRALTRERDLEAAETRQLMEIVTLESGLGIDDTRTRSLLDLRRLLKDIYARATVERCGVPGHGARVSGAAVSASRS